MDKSKRFKKFLIDSKGVAHGHELLNNIIEKIKVVKINTGHEYETGKIIDDKKEFGIRINFGSLPNNSEKRVDSGLNLSKITVTSYGGMVIEKSTHRSVPINCPFSAFFSVTSFLNEDGYIRVNTITDMTNYNGYVDITYIYN